MNTNRTVGIRGAITVEANTSVSIKESTLELLSELLKQNEIKKEMISHVIFTMTNDLNAEFPAKFARIEMGWDDVAMMCFNELNIEDSLKMCLRVLIVFNCDESFVPKFVYLKNAKSLRA